MASLIENTVGISSINIVFGFPCFYHRNIDQLLNKDVIAKCEFKVDEKGTLYHVVHFKNGSSSKLISQLPSCRYVAGYNSSTITLFEIISTFILTPLSRISVDTRFVYLCILFNDIFMYINELTQKKIINSYLMGNEHRVKLFCDNIVFVNAHNRLSFLLRNTLMTVESSKCKHQFIRQYTSILFIVKYILFSRITKSSRIDINNNNNNNNNDASNGINKSSRVLHDGICKLKQYKCRMTFIDESQLHSVFCMQLTQRNSSAYKLLRLIDIFNIPVEPSQNIIHQVFSL
ncbi:ToNVorf29 [Microplitis demolitor]|uniref:uncharacterized protein LOC106693440 n=1 Tax=Microplitis demolitor TaxID=69319 RepID=UPI0006D50F48|nr:uncharacterized protein LOC106693440 [Microplitis demolitor]KAG6558411.1 ToNVorf29 [Microplitis demolitor]